MFFGLFGGRSKKRRDDDSVDFWRGKCERMKQILEERDSEVKMLRSSLKAANFDRHKAEVDRASIFKTLKKQNNYANIKYRQKNGWKEVAVFLDPEIELNPTKYSEVYFRGYNKNTTEYDNRKDVEENDRLGTETDIRKAGQDTGSVEGTGSVK